jgi:hypothetical protein
MAQPAQEPLDPEGARHQIGDDASQAEQVSGERGQKLEGCTDVWIEGCKSRGVKLEERTTSLNPHIPQSLNLSTSRYTSKIRPNAADQE